MSDYDPNNPITTAIPTPDSGVDSAIYTAKLRAENANLRAMVERLTRDLAAETATPAALRAQEARVMGILADAGVPVGDVVHGVEALAARARWSRLWHREARRLWREVQGLHGMIDDMRGLPREDD